MSDSITKQNNNSIGEEKLWTIQQTADYLSLKYHTIVGMVNEGKIPFKHLGGGKRKRIIRFVPSEIKKHFAIS